MDIRDRMAEKRASITNKIDALETRVEERVMQTLDRVADQVESTVGRLSSTVETTAEDMAAGVRDTFNKANLKVQDIVDGLGGAVDLRRYFEERPFAMLGATVFAGMVVGRLTGHHSLR